MGVNARGARRRRTGGWSGSVPAWVAEAAVRLPAAPAAGERAGAEPHAAAAEVDRLAAPAPRRPTAVPLEHREQHGQDEHQRRRETGGGNGRWVDPLQRVAQHRERERRHHQRRRVDHDPHVRAPARAPPAGPTAAERRQRRQHAATRRLPRVEPTQDLLDLALVLLRHPSDCVPPRFYALERREEKQPFGLRTIERVNNYELAAVFQRIGDMLEIKGEAIYRVLAYREAARQLEALNEDVNQVAAEGRLTEIHGIGPAISSKIEELLKTGKLEYYERLKREVPETLADLLAIPGLGPKKIKLLHAELGVASMDDLRAALAAGRVRDLPGMGEKTEQRLIAEIDRWQERNRRTPIGQARPIAEDVVRQVQARCPSAVDLQPAGSLRRWCDTIGDVDFVCTTTEPHAVLDCFVSLPIVKELIGRGPTKASILTHQNVQMDLRVVPPESYGAALQYFTGSKAHNVKIRTLAQRKGLTLNEYELAEVATGRPIASRTEDDVYRALGLAWIPPELREDLGEIEAAARGELPRLVQVEDIRGDLHAHTDWSDGGESLEAMANAAAARGLEYLAITDHSQSLAMVRGLTPEKAREQWAAIDAWNAAGRRPYLLKGVELEILPDGSLDFPDDLLAQFDVVVAS